MDKTKALFPQNVASTQWQTAWPPSPFFKFPFQIIKEGIEAIQMLTQQKQNEPRASTTPTKNPWLMRVSFLNLVN